MKSMNDKKMDMGKGDPKSEGFFPMGAHVKVLNRANEIARRNYPDKQEDIINAQNSSVKDISKSLPKPGYRH